MVADLEKTRPPRPDHRPQNADHGHDGGTKTVVGVMVGPTTDFGRGSRCGSASAHRASSVGTPPTDTQLLRSPAGTARGCATGTPGPRRGRPAHRSRRPSARHIRTLRHRTRLPGPRCASAARIQTAINPSTHCAGRLRSTHGNCVIGLGDRGCATTAHRAGDAWSARPQTRPRTPGVSATWPLRRSRRHL